MATKNQKKIITVVSVVAIALVLAMLLKQKFVYQDCNRLENQRSLTSNGKYTVMVAERGCLTPDNQKQSLLQLTTAGGVKSPTTLIEYLGAADDVIFEFQWKDIRSLHIGFHDPSNLIVNIPGVHRDFGVLKITYENLPAE